MDGSIGTLLLPLRIDISSSVVVVGVVVGAALVVVDVVDVVVGCRRCASSRSISWRIDTCPSSRKARLVDS